MNPSPGSCVGWVVDMGIEHWRRLDCRRCGTPLTLANKYGRRQGGICIERQRAVFRGREPARRHEYWVRYRTKNSDRLAGLAHRSKQKLKAEVLPHYSNGTLARSKCGYSDIRALGLGHINGGGAEQRRNGFGGAGGAKFHFWLKKNNYPSGLQVLCMNCNWVKREENNELRRPRLGT